VSQARKKGFWQERFTMDVKKSGEEISKTCSGLNERGGKQYRTNLQTSSIRRLHRGDENKTSVRQKRCSQAFIRKWRSQIRTHLPLWQQKDTLKIPSSIDK